ncbi:MAG: glycoside hydrolase, partial [Candidatus Eremiobacterota bacterium]
EKICRFYAELHETFSGEIIKLAEEAVLTGMPVIRPLFWADPYDKNTYDISDEFLLGNKYLVAPVLEPDSEKRNIYLPAGLWRDYRTGREYEGPVLLSDYSVPLDCLPIFVNPDKSNSDGSRKP